MGDHEKWRKDGAGLQTWGQGGGGQHSTDGVRVHVSLISLRESFHNLIRRAQV